MSGLLRWLVRQRREHVRISFTTIWPHCDDIASFSDFVVFERIEVILDMNRNFFDSFRSEEGIGCGRA